jgi:ribose 5-phosphate isomerase A
MNNLSKLGATSITLRDGRTGKHGPAITESGNLIIDARFNKIDSELSKNIKSLVGVVEHGIFLDLCHKVVIASQDGIISERQKKERNRAR